MFMQPALLTMSFTACLATFILQDAFADPQEVKPSVRAMVVSYLRKPNHVIVLERNAAASEPSYPGKAEILSDLDYVDAFNPKLELIPKADVLIIKHVGLDTSMAGNPMTRMISAVSAKNEPLADVLLRLGKDADITIGYLMRAKEKSPTVSVDMHDVTLREALIRLTRAAGQDFLKIDYGANFQEGGFTVSMSIFINK